MKRLIFVFWWFLTVTPSQAQRQGVSVKTFLHLKAINRLQLQGWLNKHHFALLKQEQELGVDQQTYLSDQADSVGDHDALFVVYNHQTSLNQRVQYLSYSTNSSRFTQFKRDLPAFQFQLMDTHQDAQGNQISQYRNDEIIIELTALWSNRVKGNLYTISLMLATTSDKPTPLK